MTAEKVPIPSVLDTLRMAHFAMTDRLRRAQGDTLDALGLGPREWAFQLISSAPHWRLRASGVSRISTQANGAMPFPGGHSLGGTLAAIYCGLEPASVRGLVRFGAPLCFE